EGRRWRKPRGGGRARSCGHFRMAGDPRADLVARDLAGPGRAEHAAAGKDDDAVGKLKDLVEVGGEQQHGPAGIAGFLEKAMDEADRLDVEPARGVGGENEAG